MKLLIIRHGDPDYEKDSLTEKGWKEAELLSNRLAAMDIKEFYVSPLGRARDTANVTLSKMNRTAEVLPWLREFNVYDEESGRDRICWDLLPQDWAMINEYYHKDLWYTVPAMEKVNVISEANKVFEGIDKILERNGYVREGNLYRAINPNRDTIVLFCHFGVECVILSHLLGISPVLLWHGFCASPTSVTTIATEERRKGIASFRTLAFGDISHLYIAGEEPSFSARFCETYDNFEERHD